MPQHRRERGNEKNQRQYAKRQNIRRANIGNLIRVGDIAGLAAKIAEHQHRAILDRCRDRLHRLIHPVQRGPDGLDAEHPQGEQELQAKPANDQPPGRQPALFTQGNGDADEREDSQRRLEVVQSCGFPEAEEAAGAAESAAPAAT